ncbi:MAG TPA: PTS glucose transporter subunit IIA [Candidatus Anaerostipes excrementavium]|uniref:PTS glucose transporter subunit IIA n=1 Tax=Candidatus Anaerostipes excrementavium TaxID=2838463 RepID=A0A9D1WTX9_9FIRM|nr:PTS glucose transporter subunit IIA [uncultured Anaerostipes sp.]HIX66832.1 PTS glucose transporter subunit IIA [Candidatus Anaerostipes excrementavium]
MFFKRKKKNEAVEVKAFFQGTAFPLEQVKDPLFADKVMGDGVAIEPQDGTLYAPVSGTVATIFDTKHAIGYKLDNGADVLMHIGMDTVELEGKGFDLDISVGDKVQAGQLIGKVDLSYIKSQGKEVTTPVLLTTMDEYKIEFVKTEGSVNVGDVLYKISKQ